MRKSLWLAFAAPLFLAAMCEDDDDVLIVPCSTEVKPALVVYLYDANQQPITTTATVVAVEGDATFPLTYSTSGNNYQGPDERAGDYVVRVTAAGYLDKETEVIHVTANACHVNTKTIDITLDQE